MALRAYLVLLVYGSLFPLTGWRDPGVSSLALMFSRGLHGSYTDMLTNVIVYLPFGGILAWRWRERRALVGTVLRAGLAGLILSFTIENAQAWLPTRVPSLLDVILNTVGAASGALVLVLTRRPLSAAARFTPALARWWRVGPVPEVGLIALGGFALAQLSPFVPSLDVGGLRHGLRPLWDFARTGELQQPARLLYYACAFTGLGLLAALLAQPRVAIRRAFLVGAAAVLIIKIPVMSRQLSAEALMGLCIAAVALGSTWRLDGRKTLYLSFVCIVLAVVVNETWAVPGATMKPFNWLPLRGHIAHELTGLANLLEMIWPFVALACLAMLLRGAGSRLPVMLGTAFIFSGMFWLEWRQQYLPGRYGDLTDALIASAAWAGSFAALRTRRSGLFRRESALVDRPHRVRPQYDRARRDQTHRDRIHRESSHYR